MGADLLIQIRKPSYWLASRRAFHLRRQLTHHIEVISTALGASIEAGQQHVFDVVARSVVKLAHVEGAGLVVVKVSPLLQDLQNVLLDQVRVSDLVPGKEGSPLKEAKPIMINI